MRAALSTLAVAALVSAGLVLTAAPATADTFVFTGAPETIVVPPGMNSATIDALGAQGGESSPESGCGIPPGLGGHAVRTISVTPGETLQVNVGGAGDAPGVGDGDGGFNGGGNGGASVDEQFLAGGGGGASDVRQGGTALANRVVVAGGGGGEPLGCGGSPSGGDGGGENGVQEFGPCGGGGGGPAAGGVAGTPGNATGGTPGLGGDGSDATPDGDQFADLPGGGGGGGLFGGGGGCSGTNASRGGGGGGSGLCGAGCVAFETGGRAGDGLVEITFSAAPAPGGGGTTAGAATAVVGSPRFTG